MSQTVIDSLIIELGLDPKQFNKAQEEAVRSAKKASNEAKKSADDMEAAAKKTSDFLYKLRGQLLTLYAAFTAGKGIKEFIQDVVTTDIQLSRMSKMLDESITSLSEWRGAAQQAGGSADGITSSMLSMTQSLQQFLLTGESSLIPYFRALQISVMDGNGHLKKTSELYLEIADRVHGMDTARAGTILTAMGMDPGTIGLILKGRKAIEQALAAQKQFVPTPEDIALGEKFNQQWFQLEQGSTKLGRNFLTLVGPALKYVLDKVNDFVTYLINHKDVSTAFFTGLTVAVLALSTAIAVNFATAAVGTMLEGFGLIAAGASGLVLNLAVLTETALPALSEAFLALGIAIEATPIGWILTGIAAVSFAGYELYEHWDWVKSKWAALWKSMGLDVEDVNKVLRTAAEYALLALPGGSGLALSMMAEDAATPEKFVAGGATGFGPRSGGAGPAPSSNPRPQSVGSSGISEADAASFLRKRFPGIVITGQGRSEQRNREVGGVNNSLHLRNEAIDFKNLPPGVSAADVKAALVSAGFPVTEFLDEGRHGNQGPHIHWGWGAKGLPRSLPKSSSSKTTHHHTHVQHMDVHSAAKDAPGIAHDIRDALYENSFATMANSGGS